PGLAIDNVKTVVMLGFRSMNSCGVGSGPVAVADPNHGCSNIKSAVLAHELGHTLLTSSDADHTKDGSLMHAPLACNGKPLASCSLNTPHRNAIAANKWMNPLHTGRIQGIVNGGAGLVVSVEG